MVLRYSTQSLSLSLIVGLHVVSVNVITKGNQSTTVRVLSLAKTAHMIHCHKFLAKLSSET